MHRSSFPLIWLCGFVSYNHHFSFQSVRHTHFYEFLSFEVNEQFYTWKPNHISFTVHIARFEDLVICRHPCLILFLQYAEKQNVYKRSAVSHHHNTECSECWCAGIFIPVMLPQAYLIMNRGSWRTPGLMVVGFYWYNKPIDSGGTATPVISNPDWNGCVSIKYRRYCAALNWALPENGHLPSANEVIISCKIFQFL